jgi:hypothetical protein
MPVGIEEYGIAEVARGFGEREGNEVAETAGGQRVLIGEQSVEGVQVERRLVRGGLGEENGSQFPGEDGGHRFGEEDPGVGAVAGARAFDRNRYRGFCGCVAVRLHIGHQSSPSKSAARKMQESSSRIA